MDIAGYFFTNADIFVLSFAYDWLMGRDDLPASLEIFWCSQRSLAQMNALENAPYACA
jgi:hypothetical protein